MPQLPTQNATEEPSSEPLRAVAEGLNVRLTFTTPPADTFADWCTFQVSRDGGMTWQPLSAGAMVPLAGEAVVFYDYEAPLGVTSWYRVLPYYRDGELIKCASNYIGAVSATPPETDEFWLK